MTVANSYILIFTLLLLSIVLYLYLLFWWNKKEHWTLNSGSSTIIKNIHYATLIICLLDVVMNIQFNMDLRGIWTTRILIYILLFTGLLIPFVADKTIFDKLSRVYFKTFSWVPILTLSTALFIPFLGPVIVISLLGKLFFPYYKMYYKDDKLRIQSSIPGAIGTPKLEIYETKILTEKLLHHSDSTAYDIDSVRVQYDNDSTRVRIFRSEEFVAKKFTITLKKVK